MAECTIIKELHVGSRKWVEDGGWRKGDIDEEMMLLRILFQNLCSQFINLNVAILLNLLSI